MKFPGNVRKILSASQCGLPTVLQNFVVSRFFFFFLKMPSSILKRNPIVSPPSLFPRLLWGHLSLSFFPLLLSSSSPLQYSRTSHWESFFSLSISLPFSLSRYAFREKSYLSRLLVVGVVASPIEKKERIKSWAN